MERGADDRPALTPAGVSYDANPRYPVVGGAVESGFDPLAAEIIRERPRVVAVDGPAALPWDALAASLADALAAHDVEVELEDARRSFARGTRSSDVRPRPCCPAIPSSRGSSRAISPTWSTWRRSDRVRGTARRSSSAPAARSHSHDRLWYADVPKWLSLERVRKGLAGNVGQPAGENVVRSSGSCSSTGRCSTVTSRSSSRGSIAISTSAIRSNPRSLAGDALRASLRSLAERPFRVRPTFLPGPWGGQWLRRRLGIPTDAPNLAWSYELITPESGLLLGGDEPSRWASSF